jgi:predicted nucleic-acid-binding Zn-ribbon protein
VLTSNGRATYTQQNDVQYHDAQHNIKKWLLMLCLECAYDEFHYAEHSYADGIYAEYRYAE